MFSQLSIAKESMCTMSHPWLSAETEAELPNYSLKRPESSSERKLSEKTGRKEVISSLRKERRKEGYQDLWVDSIVTSYIMKPPLLFIQMFLLVSLWNTPPKKRDEHYLPVVLRKTSANMHQDTAVHKHKNIENIETRGRRWVMTACKTQQPRRCIKKCHKTTLETKPAQDWKKEKNRCNTSNLVF